MKSEVCLLVYTLAIAYAAAATSATNGRNAVGAWTPITNPSDPHVKEIAVFALTTHNKLVKDNLTLKSVFEGAEQVVSGMRYKLVLLATDGVATGKYEVIVWEKPEKKFKRLTSFTTLSG
ncbi:cysteine proteinase inhibitor 1 [Tripterygium wilfordii]|uniref:Cysteine proteinase inhibitor 1 n=1 Tax=Tripterygium wilfordii TaxID=458696 RepID=A0A7J7CCZ6_TRIWF|nr:cysteine proteinase inhibitor 1 [Tripterygium wilfordii]